MRVLFVGGTGMISSAVSPLVVSRGHDLTLINRGTSVKAGAPEGARSIAVLFLIGLLAVAAGGIVALKCEQPPRAGEVRR